MNILVVASDFPWPRTQGGHLRLATAIEALVGLGDVDLLAPYDYRLPSPMLPPSVTVRRLKTVAERETPSPVRRRAEWLVSRGLPLEVVMRRASAGFRNEFESWAADRYDLVWIDRAATFELVGRPRRGPTIVDLHDLEDLKARMRARIMHERRVPKSASLRIALARMQAYINASDWQHFQRSVSRAVDRVLLSSERDALRSGLPNVTVVPNTYDRPERPAGRIAVGEPPVALFQATFDYAPNLDAAQWLMTEVEPPLRERLPDLQLRLVGKPVPGVRRWHSPPGVTVVGIAPQMEPELRRADITVSPIRYGSGTRLKILESFAHRVPVVSTTMGADGLEVEDEVHLLIADSPEDFANSCERLLTDPALRKRLVDAAEQRFLECYESSLARARIQSLAREIALGTTEGGRADVN